MATGKKRVPIGKLGAIKVYKGSNPPLLKKGELATDGKNILIGVEKGKTIRLMQTMEFFITLIIKYQEHEATYHSE